MNPPEEKYAFPPDYEEETRTTANATGNGTGNETLLSMNSSFPDAPEFPGTPDEPSAMGAQAELKRICFQDSLLSVS